jgi:hypothetical protein
MVMIVPCVPDMHFSPRENMIRIPSMPLVQSPKSSLTSVAAQGTKKKVSFSPRTMVRTFNINNGETVDQYSRNI